jgi:hypothetical protein
MYIYYLFTYLYSRTRTLLRLQGPEYWGSKLLENVCNYLSCKTWGPTAPEWRFKFYGISRRVYWYMSTSNLTVIAIVQSKLLPDIFPRLTDNGSIDKPNVLCITQESFTHPAHSVSEPGIAPLQQLPSLAKNNIWGFMLLIKRDWISRVRPWLMWFDHRHLNRLSGFRQFTLVWPGLFQCPHS